ncbi:MAG: hypothetical protein KC621_32495 [Myxococcales bacterium]|nr:hypothetical protein [Myxococcales bacterium]
MLFAHIQTVDQGVVSVPVDHIGAIEDGDSAAVSVVRLKCGTCYTASLPRELVLRALQQIVAQAVQRQNAHQRLVVPG